MARVSPKQHSFGRGRIGPRLHGAQDTELYFNALDEAHNYVVDGSRNLIRRPCGERLGNTKDDGYVVLKPFVYSPQQSYVLEFGNAYMRAWYRRAQLMNGNVPSEIVTPYLEAELDELDTASLRDTTWIVQQNHPQKIIQRTTETTFAISDFQTVDGPYDEVNDDASALMTMSVGGVLTAIGGHQPFDAARDVGRLVRIVTGGTNWAWGTITAVNSPTVAQTDVTTAAPSTTEWRLGAFYPGSYPQAVAFFQNRLCFALRNRIFMSAPFFYNRFEPSDLDNTVQGDNAIYVTIPAVNSKRGAVSDVSFMQEIGFQLLVGSPAGMHTIQSTSLGEALTPNTATRRSQDSRGAARFEPVVIGESALYAHKSRSKLMGSYFRDSYDRIGAQDLTLPSSDLGYGKIKGITWQEEPHSIAWSWTDEGDLLGLTIQPEERVQGWHTHSIGGTFIQGGTRKSARVDSMATIPSETAGDDVVYYVAKRTINNIERRWVEAFTEFRKEGTDINDSWFVDGGQRYSGNTDAAKTITFVGAGINLRTCTANFTDPAIVSGETLMFNDGERWHHGRVSEVVVSGSNQTFKWSPTLPNAGPGPADGRWHFENDQWIQHDVDDEIDVNALTYQEPVNQTDIAQWSQAINSLSGLLDYEGEPLDLLINGTPVMNQTVFENRILDLPEGHIVTYGWHADARGALLSIEAGSQTGSAQNKQRPVYEQVMDLLECGPMEAGTGLPSELSGTWEQFLPVEYQSDDDAVLEGLPRQLFTGNARVTRDEQGDFENPRVAWRQSVPLPGIIRGVITRVAESDGR